MGVIGVFFDFFVDVLFGINVSVEVGEGGFVLVGVLMGELEAMLVSEVGEELSVDVLIGLEFAHSLEDAYIRFIDFHYFYFLKLNI